MNIPYELDEFPICKLDGFRTCAHQAFPYGQALLAEAQGVVEQQKRQLRAEMEKAAPSPRDPAQTVEGKPWKAGGKVLRETL